MQTKYESLKLGKTLNEDTYYMAYSAEYQGEPAVALKLIGNRRDLPAQLTQLKEKFPVSNHSSLLKLIDVVSNPSGSKNIVIIENFSNILYELLAKNNLKLSYADILNYAITLSAGCASLVSEGHVPIINFETVCLDNKGGLKLIHPHLLDSIRRLGLETTRPYGMSPATNKIKFLFTSPGADKRYLKNNEADSVYQFGLFLLYSTIGNLDFLNKSEMEIFSIGVAGDHPAIPANCPPGLAAVIKACLNPIAKERPSFIKICGDLSNLKQQEIVTSPQEKTQENELRDELNAISTKLLGMSQSAFDYIVVEEDSSFTSDNIELRRRLTRQGIEGAMFKDQDEYKAWKSQLIARKMSQVPLKAQENIHSAMPLSSTKISGDLSNLKQQEIVTCPQETTQEIKLRDELNAISTKLLGMSQIDFNYLVVEEDVLIYSDNIELRRRLTRIGIEGAMFKDQDEYKAWKSQLIAIKMSQVPLKAQENIHSAMPLSSTKISGDLSNLKQQEIVTSPQETMQEIKLRDELNAIRTKLLGMSQIDFNYLVVEEDALIYSDNIELRRRLTRIGIEGAMFKDQAEYKAWKSQLIAIKMSQVALKEQENIYTEKSFSLIPKRSQVFIPQDTIDHSTKGHLRLGSLKSGTSMYTTVENSLIYSDLIAQLEKIEGLDLFIPNTAICNIRLKSSYLGEPQLINSVMCALDNLKNDTNYTNQRLSSVIISTIEELTGQKYVKPIVNVNAFFRPAVEIPFPALEITVHAAQTELEKDDGDNLNSHDSRRVQG